MLVNVVSRRSRVLQRFAVGLGPQRAFRSHEYEELCVAAVGDVREEPLVDVGPRGAPRERRGRRSRACDERVDEIDRHVRALGELNGRDSVLLSVDRLTQRGEHVREWNMAIRHEQQRRKKKERETNIACE